MTWREPFPRRRDLKLTARQCVALAGRYDPPWTLAVHAPEVVAERRAHLASMPVRTQVSLALAVSAGRQRLI